MTFLIYSMDSPLISSVALYIIFLLRFIKINKVIIIKDAIKIIAKPTLPPNLSTLFPNIGDMKLCINSERDVHIVNALPVYSSETLFIITVFI